MGERGGGYSSFHIIAKAINAKCTLEVFSLFDIYLILYFLKVSEYVCFKMRNIYYNLKIITEIFLFVIFYVNEFSCAFNFAII